MAAKTSEWRPGPTVCRCCLTEGCYKDISTEYFWMGRREVYEEMLKDTLEITISYSKAGGPNSNSRLICEPCISRLRDATEFKRQVVECERMFMHHLDPASTSQEIEVEAAPVEKIKVEGVKLENSHSDDDFGDHHFGDDDDDDDDLDNQPLTKLASKIPKKESVDFLDLLDNSKAAEKRKATSKAKAPPPKKTKTKVEPPSTKPSSSKAKPEKKKKEITPLQIARQNARILLRYATIFPFRLPENSLSCLYCDEKFRDPALFRHHMNTNHKYYYNKIPFPDLYLKVDCTDLTCKICEKKFDKLDNVANHLIADHKKPLDLKFELGMQPFKFATDELICALCPEKFATFLALSRHNQKHFVKFTCETCGKAYVSSALLKNHVKFSHSLSNEQRICERCKNVFDTLEAKKKHISESPKCWKYTCRVCFERFMLPSLRNTHLKKAHGVDNKAYVCPECKNIFSGTMTFQKHFTIFHTDKYFECACGQKFHSKYFLDKHRVTHTKEKQFSCSDCSKSFSSKSSLVSHMWIHSEKKRFQCKLCNKPFNQKVSWKTHMKNHHAKELDDF